MIENIPTAAAAQVRPATLADLEALAGLFNAYRMFYRQADDLETARSFLSERLHRRESALFVADAGPAGLVGFAQLYPVFSSVSAQSAWILNDLFVDSAWRRRGVAAALLTAVLEHGKNTRAAWMSLQTAPDNQAAQALYKRFGFVPDDTYLSFSHSF